ncbi:MAG: hypothetical protein M1833_001800 [Piccolia ochrophora]|nr:MAG: hypothetical protein M1833_001800 [Piccolia ochrophora]
MTIEIIHQPPDPSSLTPLSTHESQTPSSFYSSAPVLHFRDTSTRILLPRTHLSSFPIFSAPTAEPAATNGHVNGTAAASSDTSRQDDDVVLSGIHLWVTSERLLVFLPALKTGLAIPYPAITLHAISRVTPPSSDASSSPEQGLYMQLATSSTLPTSNDENDDDEEDDDFPTLSLTLLPSPSPTATPTPTPTPSSAPTSTESLFAALATCSNLHPSPPSPSSPSASNQSNQILFSHSEAFAAGLIQPGSTETGGLPPPFPGSGGWITAENVGEYFDEDGNWIGGGDEGGLGPGAGTVRGRDDEDEPEGDEDEAMGGDDNGQGEAGDTKWRRTE